MKDKKDFVSFFEDSHIFVTRGQGNSSDTPIIKKHQVQSPRNITKYQWDEVSESVPDVVIIENEGRIEAIKFKCKCGCGTLV
ncbi:MAG TPA: hypothetical protein ENK14_00025, partial [Caldithrix sp.]|nr:hypothetical protein [Caldithrix sp.]